MPTGKNWLNFTYVNLGFAVGMLSIYYFSSLQDIRDNWPVYRCNPMYMPLSTDIKSDFTYCVQNMTKNMMGYLLQPLTYVLSNLGEVSSSFMTSINSVREMFNKIRNFATNIIQSIFGVFLNIIIEFQRITMGIKDLVGKMLGILVTLLYLMDGTIKTMNSAWNGPPGQMTRALGNCFHPETKVKLQNGETVFMKDLNLGDILENGSIVEATMKINNTKREKLYKIKDGVDGEYIYVTGEHLIKDVNKGFIEVKDFSEAEIQDEITCSWFSCIITNNHIIRLGDRIFWDWEDYIIKL